MLTTFKRDSHFRGQLFHKDSFQHQGKANIYMLYAIMDYLPAGGYILDPMAGTGSALVYTDYAYPVICGELEPHWAKVCEINHQTISRARLFSNSTPALCNQWDAARLPLASNSIPAIVTSPPYWDMLSDWHITSHNLQGEGHPDYGIAYGVDPRNVGNIHIYENYLRAMFAIYHEAYRVLRPGGILALILKDRIHKGRVVPIARDTQTLCLALGFIRVDKITRKVTNSIHRNILEQKHPDIPKVNTETALIFRKPKAPSGLPKNTAILQAPKQGSAPSWQLFQKAFVFTYHFEQIYILNKNNLIGPYWYSDQLEAPVYHGFRHRKEYAFDCVHDIVAKCGLTTGSEIELHCSQAYAKYLTQRLETLGMTVTNPTKGLNMGQKLKFYTERNAIC